MATDPRFSADESPKSSLPPPLQAILSAVIVVHFAAIGVNILSEPSGPWPALDGMGVGLADSPAFITEGITETARNYVQAVRLAETGRFPSIRLQPLQVHLEAVLFDKDGKEIGVRNLPDPSSSPWNRSREQLIAQALANDIMRPNPGSEAIPPAGQEPVKVAVWRSAKPDDVMQQLMPVPVHLLTRPPDPPDWGPSEWGLSLSRSYAVHLCRETGAASVEIRRHWRYQPAPFMIQGDTGKLGPRELEQLGERISSYGKVSDAEQR